MVNVYDSNYVAVSTHLHVQIACLLMTKHAEITINFVDMMKQSISYNRGLYAIAYATALAYGNDPAIHQYSQEKVRPHLWKCLNDRKMEFHTNQFILSLWRKARLCRMPEIKGQPMFECTNCQEWYHFGSEWYCTKCMTSLCIWL